MTAATQAFRFDGTGGVGRKNSKIQRLGCRYTIVFGCSLYSNLPSSPSNRRAAVRKCLTLLSFAGYVIYLVLDKTQAANGVADSIDRFTVDRATFDVISVKPLRDTTCVAGMQSLGSFLAMARWGEMRSPVFAHVTPEILHFVSENNQRHASDNGTRMQQDISSASAIVTHATAQARSSPTIICNQ